jgi:quercetin dioxygenase-like cupin family protein
MSNLSNGVQRLNLQAAPSFSLGGATVRPFSAERLTVAHVEFPAGAPVAPHSHPHEQVTVVERGRLRFTVDGGEPFDAGPGELVYVPGNLEHSVEVLEDAVYIDVFSPVREEFMQQLSGA